MEFWIGILLLVLFFAVPNWITNQKVDTGKMMSDKIKNNLSDMQVRRNVVNGKYDKR